MTYPRSAPDHGPDAHSALFPKEMIPSCGAGREPPGGLAHLSASPAPALNGNELMGTCPGQHFMGCGSMIATCTCESLQLGSTTYVASSECFS